MINNVTMLSIVLTGAALIREREHGTIEHLLVMPVTPFEIMTSKIWSMGAGGARSLRASPSSSSSQGLLSVPIEGSRRAVPARRHAAPVRHHLAWASSSAPSPRSMPQFGLLLMLVLLPLQMLSGGMTPRESMPEVVQTIMLVAPNTHFVMLAQAILYRGAGFDVVWPQFLALIGIGLALFAYSLAQFRSSLK